MPSRTHLTEKVLHDMYIKLKQKVSGDIQRSSRYSMTTDTWTSVSCDNYMTITIHLLIDWKIKSYVLSTCCSNEPHTSTNLKEQFDTVFASWNLKTNGTTPVMVTTDNAANIKSAISSSKYDLRQIGCFAHTINLAVQKANKTRTAEHIIAQVKQIVKYFHRSPTAKGVLTSKQQLLQKKPHRLIIDVSTRWNSTLAMLVRFEEQRSAVYAALDELKKNDLLLTLSRVNAADVEHMISFLQPFKMVTDVISGENYCTVSLIKPLITTLMEQSQPSDDDPKILKEMKVAVVLDLKDRYGDCSPSPLADHLYKCSLIDPRLKKIAGLSDIKIDLLYDGICADIVAIGEAVSASSSAIEAVATASSEESIS